MKAVGSSLEYGFVSLVTLIRGVGGIECTASQDTV